MNGKAAIWLLPSDHLHHGNVFTVIVIAVLKQQIVDQIKRRGMVCTVATRARTDFNSSGGWNHDPGFGKGTVRQHDIDGVKARQTNQLSPGHHQGVVNDGQGINHTGISFALQPHSQRKS